MAPSALSSQPGDVNLTLYQGGISLVRDIRQLDLTRGENPTIFTGLPQSVFEQSLLIRLDGNAFNMIYRNARPGYYDMMRSLVGKEVRLAHRQGREISGILEQFDGGFAVVRLADGSRTMIQQIEEYLVNSAHLDAMNAVYPQVGFSATPTRAGRQAVQLYYLTGGLNWNTQYTLIVDEREQSGELRGEAIIQNNTGMAYHNVTLQLMAGSLNIGQSGGGRQVQDYTMARKMAMNESSIPMAPDAVAFSEFQRYDLIGVYNLVPGESRHVPLVNTTRVNLTKRYRYTSTDRRMEVAEGSLVRVMFDLSSSGQSGAIDRAVPGGVVRMYKREGATLQIIGEDQIRNTPARGPIRITTSRAFDILVRENQISMTRISEFVHDQVSEIVLTNTKNEDIVVEIERNLQRNQRITTSSIRPETPSAGQAIFRVPVKKGETVTLSFTLRTDRN